MAGATLAAFAFLAPADDAGAAAPHKSIVDPKYRGHKNNDFITSLIEKHATAYKDVTKQVAVEGSEEKATVTEQKPNGVDIDGLFLLAKINNIDVAKFHEQRDGQGFAGRFRMTVANMLRAAARNRHGIYEPGEDGGDPVWLEASAEWLENSKPAAPAEPTYGRDGVKIKKAKPAKESATAEDAKEPVTA